MRVGASWISRTASEPVDLAKGILLAGLTPFMKRIDLIHARQLSKFQFVQLSGAEHNRYTAEERRLAYRTSAQRRLALQDLPNGAIMALRRIRLLLTDLQPSTPTDRPDSRTSP